MSKASVTVAYGLALPEDDADLRRLARETPMNGRIRMAFAREPRFFDASRVEGRSVEVIVGRDVEKGKIRGLGARAIKNVFVNGEKTPIGYLSSLRIEEEYRSLGHMLGGYDFLRYLHRDGKAELYLTNIMEDNPARRLLESGRFGLPKYHDRGRFCTLAVSLRQRAKTRTSSTLDIRRANRLDVPQIIRFLNSEGPAKQFFPQYTEQDIVSDEGLLQGLAVEDIVLAFDGNALVGTVAAWDQKSFRQDLIIGYQGSTGAFRLVLNVAARILGYPALPPAGTMLDDVYLALVCVKENGPDIFLKLLDSLVSEVRKEAKLLMVGLHERDPLLGTLDRFRSVPCYSRLYVACWEDGEKTVENLDDRIPYVELGAL
jgi:hypothetical protein